VASQRLRELFDIGVIGGLTDRQLLEQFSTGHREMAEAAFVTLVERHGPMVLGVCRGVLGDLHDVHDTFQATFLVLVCAEAFSRRGRRPDQSPKASEPSHSMTRYNNHAKSRANPVVSRRAFRKR
jgi:hypothetical protein